MQVTWPGMLCRMLACTCSESKQHSVYVSSHARGICRALSTLYLSLGAEVQLLPACTSLFIKEYVVE